ncbi:UNVERIFIED_CONTAM: hypothetical protein NCL1_26228 [Trichonephila clavipes]
MLWPQNNIIEICLAFFNNIKFLKSRRIMYQKLNIHYAKVFTFKKAISLERRNKCDHISSKGRIKYSEKFASSKFKESVRKAKIRAVHEAVAKGQLREVRSVLTRKRFALSRDHVGASPLHLAVLHGHTDVSTYIISHFPETMDGPDNILKTTLKVTKGSKVS